MLDLHARVMRLLERRGLLEVGADDPLTEYARINLVLYAGVLAPNAKLRPEVVAYARPKPLPGRPATETQFQSVSSPSRCSWPGRGAAIA